jgi:hypothetical protein
VLPPPTFKEWNLMGWWWSVQGCVGAISASMARWDYKEWCAALVVEVVHHDLRRSFVCFLWRRSFVLTFVFCVLIFWKKKNFDTWHSVKP